MKKNKEDTARSIIPFDRFIHEQRLRQEILFQYFIKEESLQRIPVVVVKDLACRIECLLNNLNHRFTNDSVKETLTDSIANSQEWIPELIESHYIDSKKVKRG